MNISLRTNFKKGVAKLPDWTAFVWIICLLEGILGRFGLSARELGLLIRELFVLWFFRGNRTEELSADTRVETGAFVVKCRKFISRKFRFKIFLPAIFPALQIIVIA